MQYTSFLMVHKALLPWEILSSDSNNLNDYSASISLWQNSFDVDADLLIYGCELAGNAAGESLISQLSTLTSTDVAASVDDTGNILLGGDWTLEFSTGSIETEIAFSKEIQHSWDGLLAYQTYRDEFNSVSLANTDGTQNWASGAWQEIGESDGVSAGDVTVSTVLGEQGLSIKGSGNGALREVDLSSATSANLSFDYARVSLDDSVRVVVLEISGDGGGSWSELNRWQGSADDTSLQYASFDISDYIASNTQIRFVTSGFAETKMKALRLGANDFLGKPVDPSELVLRIRNTLAAKVYQDRLAFYDPLTNLPNRQNFMNHLDWSLHRAKLENLSGAVLKLDLDRFKDVNDTLGPDVGDLLLKEISQRLKERLRDGDTVSWFGHDQSRTSLSRIGGNEFSMLFPEIKNVDDLVPIAQRILRAIEPPCHPRQHELYITISIGIAIFPQDGEEINTLIKHADVAISHAKQQGGNCFQFYSDRLNTQSVERLELTNDLRKAADRNELEVYYQPKVNVDSGQIIGAEALMRWNHPEHGLVSPGVFIPLAEKIGFLPVIDDYAFLTTCQQLIAWQAAGMTPITISVNITSQSFRSGRVYETAKDALDNTGLDPKYIKLELTEGTIMENAEENIKMLNKLRGLGINLSIDDFGTGYSSLSYLNRFPVNELKIDQSFISGILQEPSNLAIVKAIIAMAHSLGLHVVAEGVETKKQLAIIQSLNCTEYQGYLFSKPIQAKEFQKLLSKDKEPEIN